MTIDYPMPIVPGTVASLKPNVEDNFTALMQVATNADSIYQTMMTKIEKIYIDGAEVTDDKFSTSERAKLISDMAASIVPTITNQAMQVAFQMAKEDRDAIYTYPGLEADVQAKNAQANKTIEDAKNADMNKNKLAHENLLAQASLKRDFGLSNPAWLIEDVDSVKPAYGNDGIKYFDYLGRAAQTYYTYAKSYRENGSGYVNLNTNNSAFYPDYSTFSRVSESTTTEAQMEAGLTANQTRVQWRVYNGFDDNMAQHAVNASANMVATMFTEEAAADVTCSTLRIWNEGIARLYKNDYTPETYAVQCCYEGETCEYSNLY